MAWLKVGKSQPETMLFLTIKVRGQIRFSNVPLLPCPWSPWSGAFFADPPVPVEWRLNYGTVEWWPWKCSAKIKHKRSRSKLLSCRTSEHQTLQGIKNYSCLAEMISYLNATSKLIESRSFQCPPRLARLLELPRGKDCHLVKPPPLRHPCLSKTRHAFFVPK